MLSFLRRIQKIWNEFSESHPFKIVEIVGEPGNKNSQVIYQVSGKSTVVTGSPEKLVAELLSLKGFSKKDSELIHDLAVMESISPACRIVTIYSEAESVLFEIENIRLGTTDLFTAEQIMCFKDFIQDFSCEDVMKIYFEHYKNGERAEEKAKKLLAQKHHSLFLIKETEET